MLKGDDMLKHGILGLLNYKDMTGYELMEFFRDSLNFFWNAQTSQIYKELQTLERNGWAVSKISEQSGKPDKRIYHITEDGKTELKSWLKDYALKPVNYSFLLKTFFLGELKPEDSLPFFYMYRESSVECLRNLNQVPEIIDSYEEILEDASKSVYWAMTVEYGKRDAQMSIEWCDYCIEQIKNINKK